MTTLRAAAQQALEALNSIDVGYRSPSGDPLEVSFDEVKCEAAITALRAALAQKHDPVARSGWVLREVLFENGEPIGHREPQHSPAALAQQANHLTIERLRVALVASRIIDPAAVEDPDGYDDGVTLHRIEALHRRIA